MSENRKEEVLATLVKVQQVRVVALARKLGMWDSNLRKILKQLIIEKKIEKFLDNNYTCVRMRKT